MGNAHQSCGFFLGVGGVNFLSPLLASPAVWYDNPREKFSHLSGVISSLTSLCGPKRNSSYTNTAGGERRPQGLFTLVGIRWSQAAPLRGKLLLPRGAREWAACRDTVLGFDLFFCICTCWCCRLTSLRLFFLGGGGCYHNNRHVTRDNVYLFIFK